MGYRRRASASASASCWLGHRPLYKRSCLSRSPTLLWRILRPRAPGSDHALSRQSFPRSRHSSLRGYAVSSQPLSVTPLLLCLSPTTQLALLLVAFYMSLVFRSIPAFDDAESEVAWVNPTTVY